MAPDARDWSVPVPLRTLLWWPGVSFVLVLIVPDTAAWSIAIAGLALVAFGAVVAALRSFPAVAEPVVDFESTSTR